MTDDVFGLTPVEVRRQDFGTTMRGYDKAQVEEFRGKVADRLEELTRQNQELEAKARGFHEQLRAFRERDKALNDALVSAQQLRAEIRDQAEREAQLVLREARVESDRALEVARSEIRRLEEEIMGLQRVRRTYLAQLRQVIERQLSAIEAAEADVPTVQRPESSKEPHQPTPAWLESLTKE